MEKQVENINIEKNKELFEYEMTEVILKLKGEFAAFSGKDTEFAKKKVEDEKLQISTPTPVRVETETPNISIPKAEAIAIDGFSENSKQEIKAADINVPDTNVKITTDIAKADPIQKPTITIPQTDSALTEVKKAPDVICEPFNIELPTANNVKMPEINKVSITNPSADLQVRELPQVDIPAVEVAKPNINISYASPAMAVDLTKDVLVSCETLSVDLPEIKKINVPDINIPDIDKKSIEIAPIEQPLTDIAISAPNVKTMDIPLPILKENSTINIETIETIPANNVTIPQQKDVPIYEMKNNLSEEMPDISFPSTQLPDIEVKAKKIDTSTIEEKMRDFVPPQKPKVDDMVDQIIALALAEK